MPYTVDPLPDIELALAPAWSSGCAQAVALTLNAGSIELGEGGGLRCAVHASTAEERQFVSAHISASSLPGSSGSVGLIARYQDAERFLFGGIESTAGGGFRGAIKLFDPSLVGGYTLLGFGPLAEGFSVSQESGALLDSEGQTTSLQLQVVGSTLRLFLISGGERRMIAAALDAFEVGESTTEPTPLSPGLELSQAGRAGIFSAGVSASFSDFSVR